MSKELDISQPKPGFGVASAMETFGTWSIKTLVFFLLYAIAIGVTCIWFSLILKLPYTAQVSPTDAELIKSAFKFGAGVAVGVVWKSSKPTSM